MSGRISQVVLEYAAESLPAQQVRVSQMLLEYGEETIPARHVRVSQIWLETADGAGTAAAAGSSSSLLTFVGP